MCVVGSFRWQVEFFHVLAYNVCCWVFQVAMCVVGSFMWQYVFLGLLGSNVSCWVF